MVFDYVYGLSYLCHKISLNLSRSYIDSSNWIKNATINIINKYDGKCFQYAAKTPLIHKIIWKNSQRISKLSFLEINIIGKEQIIHQEKMIRKDLKKIMLLMFCIIKMINKIIIKFLVLVSKHNSERKNTNNSLNDFQ